MIPYDDLAAALTGWRQRQGLPVTAAAAAVVAARATAPRTTAPRPAAPAPVPVAAPMPIDEVEETHYDSEGDDYAIPLGEPGEATSIGGAPKRNDW